MNDTVKVYVTANTNGRSAQALQITFTWAAVSGDLTYVGLDTAGYTLDPSDADFEDTLYNDTLRVTITGTWTPQSFAGDTLFAAMFRLECMPTSTWKTIPIVGACNDDRTFFQVADTGTFVGVAHNHGQARIKPLSAELFFEGSVMTLPRDTAEMVVDYTANFNVLNGYVFHCSFDPDDLTYVGYTQTGYASASHTLSDTVLGDTMVVIRSGSTDVLVPDTGEALFGVLFSNQTTDDSTTFPVTQHKTLDTMYMCSEAYAVNGTSVGGASVFTPVFSATYAIKDMSVTEGASSVMDFMLTNTHRVDMQTELDSAMATFRLDAAEFNWVTVDTADADQDVNESGLWYYWEQLTGLGADRRVFREDYNSESYDMLVHSSPTKVAGVEFTAKYVTSTKYDWIFFDYATSQGDASWKKDIVLKALHIAQIIRPDTVLGDNHITLDSGRITVMNQGGGGSCPFVYTWNGSEYVLEDVILTASETRPEGESVTDYLPLNTRPEPVNGSYRLRIHEQEAEKTFLDNMELLVVDHDPGWEMAVDIRGNLVFGQRRLRPIAATDDFGEDVVEPLATFDGWAYQRAGSGSLTVTFQGERGTHYAISAGDSTGTNGADPKPECKIWAGPVSRVDVKPALVKLEVEDIDGVWHEIPRGPMRLPGVHMRPVVNLSEYNLDANFRIRYNWEGPFELDELALVVQEPVQHSVRRAAAVNAIHSGDHPTAPLVRREDGRFAELVTGEFLDLEFPAEPIPSGMERSFVLVASGYYLTWFGHENAGRPLEFGLNGNYPNPFNPSTTIRYSLASETNVTLEIFNILGQRVRTLVSGELQVPGSYEAFWDGKDEQRNLVGSGAYLYRLGAGDFEETRKMILLK